MRAAIPMGCYDCMRVAESCFGFWSTVLIIKGVRESTLSVGKSRARDPTQNPTQNPTPNRPEPGRTAQRLRTAPCPQALRSARGVWRAHGPLSEEIAQTVLIIKGVREITLSVGLSRWENPARAIPPRIPPRIPPHAHPHPQEEEQSTPNRRNGFSFWFSLLLESWIKNAHKYHLYPR